MIAFARKKTIASLINQLMYDVLTCKITMKDYQYYLWRMFFTAEEKAFVNKFVQSYREKVQTVRSIANELLETPKKFNVDLTHFDIDEEEMRRFEQPEIAMQDAYQNIQKDIDEIMILVNAKSNRRRGKK